MSERERLITVRKSLLYLLKVLLSFIASKIERGSEGEGTTSAIILVTV